MIIFGQPWDGILLLLGLLIVMLFGLRDKEGDIGFFRWIFILTIMGIASFPILELEKISFSKLRHSDGFSFVKKMFDKMSEVAKNNPLTARFLGEKQQNQPKQISNLKEKLASWKLVQEAKMNHTLPKLPYNEGDLAPILSAEAMRLHYGKHHQAYVNNLNKYIIGTEFEKMTLGEIVQKANGAILNNAAQHWNHSFYWHCLTPSSNTTTSEELRAMIIRDFESLENLKTEFTRAAIEVFGSGWAWLVHTKDGKLEVQKTSNAGNPIQDGDSPLLTCDVWEHAYYVDYKNERNKYLASFWDIIDWDFVSNNLASTQNRKDK